MLTFHFLNVNHGDSIIIQNESPKNGTHYGLIDSNNPNNDNCPPALKKLQSLGAEKLSFVALTHPHADHYSGLSQILETYKGKIDHFFSFPISDFTDGRLSKLTKIYARLHDETDSPLLKRNLYEFVYILSLVNKNIKINNWYQPSGFSNRITPTGFSDVECNVILPNPSVKGKYFQMIENEDYDVVSCHNLNELSMGFHFKFKNFEIVLGGDCIRSSWLDHKRHCNRGGIEINGHIVKLPHHGSKHECDENILDHLLNKDKEKETIAILSADGQSHPHPEVLERLIARNAKIYCTNLSLKCGGTIKEYKKLQGINSALGRFLNLVSKPSSEDLQPCQGDISLSINDNGELSVKRQFLHPCVLTNDYDFLIA